MNGRDRRSRSPVPTAMVRRPVRTTSTGTAWSGSVMQQRLGAGAAVTGDLADHAAGVDQRLADEGAVAAAAVEDDAMAQPVHVHGDDLGDQHLVADLGGGIQQRAHARVFGFQRRHALQAPGLLQQLLP